MRRLILGLSLFGLITLIAFWGYKSSRDKAIAKPSAIQKLLKDPIARDNQTVTILYTGNTQSYLEPCGCYVGQSGGIARRATLIERFRQAGVEFLLVDAGGVFDGTTSLDQSRTQIYLKAMETIGYDAISLSQYELQFGPAFLSKITNEIHIPFLSQDTKFVNREILIKPGIIRNVGEFQVALVGISRLRGIYKLGLALEKPPFDPFISLKQYLSEIRDTVKLVVLLSDLSPETNRKVASQLKGIDVIISNREGQTEKIGDVIIIHSVPQGKAIGRLDLKVDNTGKVLDYKVTDLYMDETVPDHPRIRALLNNFYNQVAINPDLQAPTKSLFSQERLENDPTNGYIGEKGCQDCHSKEYDQWRTTEHAFAFHTLLRVQRHFYPDCVSCHTTGFGYPTGFKITDLGKGFENVQCETCHGPGRKHAANPRKDNIRKKVPVELCAQCHDAEHSPKFKERAESLMTLVDHSQRASKAAEMVLNRLRNQSKVTIDLFVMPYCPYGRKAENDFIPVVKKYRERMNFNLYFIAKEKEESGERNNSKELKPWDKFVSPHGQEEVKEGIRQAVIAQYYPKKYLDYVLCRGQASITDATNWEGCAKTIGIDLNQVKQLADGKKGEKLYRMNIQKALTLKINESPTIFIDGNRYGNEAFYKKCFSSRLSPLKYSIKNFPVNQMLPDTLGRLSQEEYAEIYSLLEDIRQKLKADTPRSSNLNILNIQNSVNQLEKLSKEFPSTPYLKMLLAETYQQQGMSQLAEGKYQQSGIIVNTQWAFIGPFGNNRWFSGFKRKYPPEKEINLVKVYQGPRRQKIKWMKPKYEVVNGYVDLTEVMRTNQCAGYALAYIHLPSEILVQFYLSVSGAVKLWLNKKLVFADKIQHQMNLDEFVIPVTLKKGTNEILIKLIHSGDRAGFVLRVTDQDGHPISQMRINPPPIPGEHLSFDSLRYGWSPLGSIYPMKIR